MKKNILIAIVIVAVLVSGYNIYRAKNPAFCFDFVRDIQYGDRKVEKPINLGIEMPGGIVYYAEVTPLQTALKKEGY